MGKFFDYLNESSTTIFINLSCSKSDQKTQIKQITDIYDGIVQAQEEVIMDNGCQLSLTVNKNDEKKLIKLLNNVKKPYKDWYIV